MSELFEAPDASTVDGGARSIQTGAMRVGSALARAVALIPATLAQQALSILTPENLWTTSVILVVWLVASVIGGPIGLLVNGILIALALYQIPELAAELGSLLKEGLVLSWNARSEADLDKAAVSFAAAMSAATLEILQVFVTHRIFVFAKPKLVRKFRVPARIEAEHKRATSRVGEKLKAVAEKTGLKTAAEVGAAAGVQPAADNLGTIAAIGVGLLAVGAGVTAVVALSKKEGNR